MAEIDQWDFDPSGAEVRVSGLLSREDVAEIVSDIEWVRTSRWLRSQSFESMRWLRANLPDPKDEETVELFDNIEASLAVIQLPADFIELCRHYAIDPPDLERLCDAISSDVDARK